MKQFPSLNMRLSQSGSLNRVVAVVFALVVVLLLGGYFYFNPSNRGVSVDINLPQGNIYPGEILDVDVSISNNSKSQLQNTRLTLNFPKGIKLLDNKDRVNEVRELKDEVGAGALVKETYKVVILPGGGPEDYTLEAKANYSTESFSNDFERRQSKKVDVKTDGFKLEMTAPENVSTGESFPIEVTYGLPESERESLGKFLVLEGPALRVLNANMEQVSENRWLLEKGNDQKINTTVVMDTKPSDVFFLKGKVVVEFGGEDYVIFEKQSEVTLVGSSLALSVDLADPKGFVSPGEQLTYKVSYKNNTGIELKDALLRVELVGDMFDFSSIQTSGTFDSLSRTVTWNSSRFGELRELAKGEEGSFNVDIKVKPNFPTNGVSDKNFTLKAKGSIESPTVIQGTNTDRTSNFANSEVNVSGNIAVDTRAYFRDATSGILNEGPFPPKVGQATEYTVHWNLANAGTDVDEVTVRAHLENGVSFTGEVKGTTNTLPTLDASSNEVVWTVGAVSVGGGMSGNRPEAIFQVSLTPGVGLLGQFAPLLGITSVSAKDVFTDVSLLGTDSALTTKLVDDSTVGLNQGKVIQ
ncbi:MAG: hypothetical protein UX77_C0007G0013 [Parcubacteria group bacterium GW2011_GWA1_47_11]|nr:MAG: hypothetical protein UX29_C0013G0013 [Parcubacteria group bacterium GW2011_GWA2_46_10]KKU55808.1 MAG: hypothetical protein UX77_C0007G0013 [Parcubacteria group bacterium GW2011_GWA1_47_11]